MDKMTDEQMEAMAPGEYTTWEKRVWRRGYETALAQQPAADPLAAEKEDVAMLAEAYMAGRLDERKEVQQPAAVDDKENRDTWRALWLVLRQTGTVAVPRHDIVSADWSRCQVEQTEHEMTGTVRLRAILLAAQPGGSQ